jgi:hypothetical protein
MYRNLLAMETEEILRSYPADGCVLLGGCDKTTPALLMGAISMDLPTIFMPAGPMLRGNWRGQQLGSGSDVWKFHSELRAGNITEGDWSEIEDGIARSPGHCMTMGTASTMTSAAEAMGLTLPQTYRFVLLPMAFRIVIPPLTSESMNIIKNSSVAFAVSIAELTMFALQAGEETSRNIEMYLAVTGLYFISAFSINRVMLFVEGRVRVPGMIGSHPALGHVFDIVARIARTPATVLVTDSMVKLTWFNCTGPTIVDSLWGW